MNVAVLTDGIMPFVLGSVPMHSANLVRHLAEKGLEITVVHCVKSTESVPTSEKVLAELQIPEEGKVKIIGLHFPSSGQAPGHYIRENYRYSVAVFKAIEADLASFDFIYAQGLSGWRTLELKRNGLHIPPVGVNFHGLEMFQKSYGLKSRLINAMLKPSVIFNMQHADVVFSFGNKLTAIIEKAGVLPEKIAEVPGALDENWLRHEELKQDGVRHFIFIAHNQKRKGYEELKKALQRLKNRNFMFDLVGPISPLQQVQAPNIRYHGEIKDRKRLIKLLDRAHVLVCPSHSDGMPAVILEAMGRGLAVIATDVGVIPLLVNSSNGMIIPPHKSREICRAMEHFIAMSDAELLEARRQSRHKAEHFLWNQVADQIIEVLRERTHRQ